MLKKSIFAGIALSFSVLAPLPAAALDLEFKTPPVPCYGTNAARVCLNPVTVSFTDRQLISECIYLGSGPCTPVRPTAPVPKVTGGPTVICNACSANDLDAKADDQVE